MKYLKVFVDFRNDIEPLSFEERGRLFTSMLQYAETGEESELTGNERFLWGTAKRHIDTQAESYRRQCDANARNITKRYEPLRTATNVYESNQDKDKDKDKETNKPSKEGSRRFTPPTADEVAEYCDENGYTIDPERFVSFYAQKGWMVGKNHMVDWKAAVRNWVTRDRAERASKAPHPQYSNAELEKLEVDLNGGDFSW